MNAGGKFSKEFPAAKVPELREVLGLLLQKNYRGMLMIEIKTDQYEYPGIEEKLAETLKSRDWPFQHAYCSFHLDSLEKIALLEPEIQLDLLMSTSDKKIQLAAETPYIEGVHPKILGCSNIQSRQLIFQKQFVHGRLTMKKKWPNVKNSK